MIPTDEIISMAREAGIEMYPHPFNYARSCTLDALAAFAALVSARAAAIEREAIASILENTDLTQAGEFQLWIAKLLGHYVYAIRARGDQHEQ